MISKEEFEYVWKDSSVCDILNQFYYEHIDLRNLLKVLDELEKYLKEQNSFFKISDMGYSYGVIKNILDKLKELKEEYNVSDYNNN